MGTGVKSMNFCSVVIEYFAVALTRWGSSSRGVNRIGFSCDLLLIVNMRQKRVFEVHQR